MRIIYANKPVIFLGMQGEDGAEEVRFPVVSQWREIYGDGVFALAFKRPTEDTAYACTVTEDGDDVCWVISSTEVAIAGNGAAELLYYVDGDLAKSATYVTTSVESITASESDPPEPWESWVEDVIAAGAAAQQSATEAAASALAASGDADDAEDAADDAEDAADAAEESRQAAEAAAGVASRAVAGIVYATFAINEDGYLEMQNAEALANIEFSLNYNTGNLEVQINA